MLAAEVNCGEIFNTLMKFGGDPFQKDASGMDCRKIAYAFSSNEIVAELKSRGYW